MEGLVVCGACFQFLHTVDVFVIVLVLWNWFLCSQMLLVWWCVCFQFSRSLFVRACYCATNLYMHVHTYICVCVKNGCNHTQMYRALYVCAVCI